jgi:hypothetical protein
MTERAADVYALQLRLGKSLPKTALVPLVLLRNLILTAITTLPMISGVPEWIIVTRRSDGSVVGRISAGDDGEGPELLATMSSNLDELSPSEFLATWHLTHG